MQPFNALDSNIQSLFIASEKKKLLDNSMFLKKLNKIGEHVNEADLEERKVP